MWGINSLATSPNSSELLDSCNKSWSISRIDRGLLLWWWHDSPKIHKRGYKRRQKRATNDKCPDCEKESCDEWCLQKHGIGRELWGRKRIGFQACLFLPLLGQKKRQGATGKGILNANQAIIRIQGTNSKLGSGGKEQQTSCSTRKKNYSKIKSVSVSSLLGRFEKDALIGSAPPLLP